MKDYKIAVAGTGYVGLSIATLLSQHHQVTAVDIVPEKVELINNRKKIYGKLKRVKNEELKAQYETDRDDITSKIAHLKKQLRLCHDIENRVPDIEEKLKQINELEEQKNEKQQEYERSLNI